MATATKPETTSKTLGENITYTVSEDNQLVITIDLNHRGGTSASGKTVRVASSEGNSRVTPDVFLGLNAYVKNT